MFDKKNGQQKPSGEFFLLFVNPYYIRDTGRPGNPENFVARYIVHDQRVRARAIDIQQGRGRPRSF